MTSAMPARCSCGAKATNQALYRRRDGSHFLGNAVCNDHRYIPGRPEHAWWVEIVDYIEVASV